MRSPLPPQPPAEAASAFAAAVIAWGRAAGRPFQWREPGLSTFELLLTEVLLARTRAAAVVPVVNALFSRWPDALSLAAADPAELEQVLQPLGLFRKRARALHLLAEKLVNSHGGTVPLTLEALLELPYVGRYAANAYLCFGLRQRRPVVDANVARLFERYWGQTPWQGKLEGAESYWALADHLLPANDVQLYNWSLLDLGALVCKPRGPACSQCPLQATCHVTVTNQRV
jgi:A/G-specific adenine glycosylase